MPGSHVVLKSSDGTAGVDDLQLASDLAALFSRARGNIRVPVVMVPTDDLQGFLEPHLERCGTVEWHVRWGDPDRARQHLSAGEAPNLELPVV